MSELLCYEKVTPYFNERDKLVFRLQFTTYQLGLLGPKMSQKKCFVLFLTFLESVLTVGLMYSLLMTFKVPLLKQHFANIVLLNPVWIFNTYLPSL